MAFLLWTGSKIVPDSNILGIDEPLLDEMVAGLAESQDVLIDTLTEDAEEMEICDRENLEILLRMARRSRQPSFKPLSLDHLPLFLASYQGMTQRGESIDALQSALDQLFGFPAGAEVWEKHILPARMSPYYGSWLDSLIQSSDLLWFGCGKRRISFAFSNDLDLFIDQDKKDGDGPTPKETVSRYGLANLLPQKIGRYSFLDIAQHSKLDSRTITNKLWDLAWQGRVSNDAFETLRRGIVTDFAPFSLKREGGRYLPCRPLTAGPQPVRFQGTGSPSTGKGLKEIPSMKPNWSKTGSASSSGVTASSSENCCRWRCPCSSGLGYLRP